MIEAAVIHSFIILLLLLCANAVIGYWAQRQAGDAIAGPAASSGMNR
jgi:hypothetical protein